MKVNKLFGLTMAVFAGISLFCSSCTREESTLPRGEEEEEVPADYVKMVFNVKDATKPESYAAGDTENDSSIGDDLMVLILLQNQEFNKDDLWHYDRARKMTKTLKGSYSVLLPSTLAGKTFKMFVCANASSILGDNPDKTLMERKEGFAYETGLSEADIITKLTFDINTNANAPHWAPKSLPMWGKSEGNSFTMADLGKEYKLKPVKLLRALIRVDVGLGYAAGATVDDPPLGLGNFKITKIHVARTLNKAQFIPTTDNYTYDQTTSDLDALNNPYTVTKISLPADAPFNTDALFEVPADDGKDGKSCIQKIYIPEQANPGGEDNFAKRPCVIVEGDYQPVEGATEAIHGFYRLDFKTTVSGADDFKDILRGSLMRMNITAVKGPGLKTVEEALKSRPLNVDVTVTSYNLLTENTVIDGQYSFSAAKKEVVMPREPGVTYKLRVVTDIPMEAWTAAFKKADPAFRVAKARVNGSDKEYTLDITSKKAWAADDGEDTLLITGKRLKMEIPVRQVNQSTADWIDGGSEDATMGSDISATSLFFRGVGGTQEVRLGGVYETILVDYLPDWLKVTQVQGTNKLTFIAAVNQGDAFQREVKVSIRKGEKTYTVIVSQLSLPIANIEDTKMGVLWRDRNEGAYVNEFDDTNAFDYTKTRYEAWGDAVCPGGWIVPSMADYESLLGSGSALLSGVYPYSAEDEANNNRDAYLMLSNETNKLYFPTQKSTNLVDMRYWVSDGYFISMTVSSIGDGVKNVIGVEQSKNQKLGSVRCVRKFKMKESVVTLNMAGDEVSLDYSTLNNQEVWRTEGTEGTEGTLKVSPVSMGRIAISESVPNLTSVPVRKTITFIGLNPRNKQKVEIVQQGKLPLADEAHPVRIGKLEWYYKNQGATRAGNAFVHYENIGGTVWMNDSITSTVGGNFITGGVEEVGGRMRFRDAVVSCNDVAGGGWRLPTMKEYSDVFKRMRVGEGKYDSGQSQVPHNTENYPIYILADDERFIYFPVGFICYGGNLDPAVVRYNTSTEASGSTAAMMTFRRVLNNIGNGNPFNNYFFQSGDNTGFSLYTRCVRTIK